MSIEQWADIPGYEGFYQASNRGRIRSLIKLTIAAHLRGERREKMVLKPHRKTTGRQQVTLCAAGALKRFQVHRLVLEAWVGPPPKDMEGKHFDKDNQNNSLDNLYWGPVTDRRSDLTDAAVREIRRREAPQHQLAEKFGVSQAAISHIQNRKTWQHVE
jgi:hypothetical protein